ncbi:DUF4815 domain-containing protein [Nitratireductor aquimarinus]|uniref:DUF4815 domain-containing protein n=1 Tax=Nitratireductor aquimarinus TaxID=889300 RepID=UPI001A8C4BBE|nr:DUF4815 domain-containing protein [Nitratireductor aquimarinus]MBN8243314.1 DUF4815 domain-containing protein [Nitratireductor aquimarinus]MBY6131215.1 DUF4815 domain-containing protein [Nitratireductor aquimarinus]MCA1302029.1 DUF4815 domain-containing protein [Nitratireductor aquimarinus]
MTQSLIKRPGYSDRFDRSTKHYAVAFPDEQRYLQSAELNEMQSLSDDKLRRVAEYILQDGRIVRGDDPVVTPVGDGEISVTVRLPECAIYVGGLVHDVETAQFELPATGNVMIGIRLAESVVTDVEDASLKGHLQGSESYMEPGAARIRFEASWGTSEDGNADPLISVFNMQDGAIITNETNTDYSEIYQALAAYSSESNGAYVFSGCEVGALGLNGDGEQVFTISEGVAYVSGRRLPRAQSLRLRVLEEPDLREVSAEPHAFTEPSGGTQTFTLSRSPIAEVSQITIIKETTETVVHGAFSGASDALTNTSVESIQEIKQGGTTYTSPADWLLSSGEIDWSPGGAEPTPGSSYTVKYRYYQNIAPDLVTRDAVTLTGATQGTNALIDYTYKLPRIDVIAMDQSGMLTYVKGNSALSRPRPAIIPSTHLELARVINRWGIAPTIVQSAVRNVPYSEINAMKRALLDIYDLVSQERLKSDVSAREVSAKRGVFVDPFLDDDMRDQGVPQTAASFGGQLRLPVLAKVHEFPALLAVQHLDFTNEAIISQLRHTHGMKINPYATFTPMPGRASLEPSSDIWTETEELWTSPEAQAFEAEEGQAITGVSLEQEMELVRTTTRAAGTIRVRQVNFRLEGFIQDEALDSATFDDVPITLTGHTPADADGVITGTFEIPADIPTGAKLVRFVGGAGTRASTTYVGRGTITVEEWRLVSTLGTTTADMPQPINPPQVINNITNITNVVNNTGSWEDPNSWDNGSSDPLAQTFTLAANRCISGVRLKCAKKGAASNAIFVQLRQTDVGIPNRVVLAEAFVPGTAFEEGEIFTAEFAVPVYLERGREYAFVVLTDDAEHSLAVASVGRIDQSGEVVTEQPFVIGVLLSSSNASTWTVHNETDLWFQLLASRFDPVEKTVAIGAFTATKMSDIIVSAGVEYPDNQTEVTIRLSRPNGEVIAATPGQRIRLDEFIENETIQVAAVLTGTALATPFLFPDVQIIEGELQTSANYESRVVQADGANRASVTFDAFLPTGSTVSVEIGEPGNFVVSSVANARPLGDGVVEQTYQRTPYAPQDAKTRITLTGTPAARPNLSSLRMVTTEV